MAKTSPLIRNVKAIKIGRESRRTQNAESHCITAITEAEYLTSFSLIKYFKLGTMAKPQAAEPTVPHPWPVPVSLPSREPIPKLETPSSNTLLRWLISVPLIALYCFYILQLHVVIPQAISAFSKEYLSLEFLVYGPMGVRYWTRAKGDAMPQLQPFVRRIVAVGDLHGDLLNARKVLQFAGVVDEEGNWTGETDYFVQTGDIIDR